MTDNHHSCEVKNVHFSRTHQRSIFLRHPDFLVFGIIVLAMSPAKKRTLMKMFQEFVVGGWVFIVGFLTATILQSKILLAATIRLCFAVTLLAGAIAINSMNRRYIALLTALTVVSLSSAKRLPPPNVKPVLSGSVEYRSGDSLKMQPKPPHVS